MSKFVITGANGGSPNRLEINDFVNDEKSFSLFVQALQAMSANDQPDTQSFFSVGGIHGLPFRVWDGAVGKTPFNPNSRQWGGYCTHGSVLFPTWHRPYVMLYEQILQQHAVEIAATYTVDTEDWKQAATNFRIPFWDWALNAVPPDQVIAQTQVTITDKDGNQVQVDNPMYHYTFHPIDPSFPDPYSSWQTTLRQPTSQDPDATDDVDMLKNVLASAQSHITSSTYNMLTRIRTWPAFSNHTVGDGGSTSNSLEAIHDGIHVNVGGMGQMADPSVAAFDPIFFMHHANVDRLLSMWSAINPGVWVSRGVAEGGGSFTTPQGAPYDQTTGLTPFWNGQTTFWPSSTVKDTSKLGYTYPDFNGVDTTNTDAAKTAISNRVNELYGTSFTGSSFAVASVPQSIPAPVSGLSAEKAPAASSTHIRSLAAAKKVPASDSPSQQHHSFSHIRSLAATTSVPASDSPATSQQHPPPSHVRSLAATTSVPASDSPATSQQHPPPSHVRSLAATKKVPASDTPATSQQHHLSTHQHMNNPTVVVPSTGPPHHGIWEWTARVEFKKYELSTSFSVLIFLGQVPSNSREWRVCHNFVGAHHAFVNSAASMCANCTDQHDIVVEGFIHLNNAIVQHSGLGSLEPNVVEPYLTNNLNWKVQKSNGDEADLQSLEVTVIATPLSYPPGAIFPVPGDPHPYNQITYGRNGGSRHA